VKLKLLRGGLSSVKYITEALILSPIVDLLERTVKGLKFKIHEDHAIGIILKIKFPYRGTKFKNYPESSGYCHNSLLAYC
jgi:hypothetical protein